jgi:HSP20 family protein
MRTVKDSCPAPDEFEIPADFALAHRVMIHTRNTPCSEKGNHKIKATQEDTPMTLTRWNPANDFMNLQREVNRLFNGITPRTRRDEEYESAVWSPVVDITEDADQYTLSFDLPGVEKKDVKMNYSDNTLTVSGERRSFEEKKDMTCHRVERAFGKFYRSFTFPTMVNAEKIGATYKDGVLTVAVPKAEETKPKQITIN